MGAYHLFYKIIGLVMMFLNDDSEPFKIQNIAITLIGRKRFF